MAVEDKHDDDCRRATAEESLRINENLETLPPPSPGLGATHSFAIDAVPDEKAVHSPTDTPVATAAGASGLSEGSVHVPLQRSSPSE